MTENKFGTRSWGYNVGELFSSFSFEVPIFQRVFTWGDEQFERLFKDLREHFRSSERNERYYLGIITVVRPETGDRLILVDGQQRLTCVLLLGALLEWKLDPSKLSYVARPADRKALEDVYSVFENGGTPSFDGISKVGNAAMAEFLRFALTPGKGLEMFEALRGQSETIKEQLTLMVSCLPDEPYRKDIFEQNRYFEKMNNGGKQLEPHEILKVQMCKDLDGVCLKTWNSVADFGRRFSKLETDGDNSFAGGRHPLSSVIEDKYPASGNGENGFLTRVYERCQDKNQLHQYENGAEEKDDLRKGLVSFPTFLLHVRVLFMERADEPIGDESRLLDLFKDLTALPPEQRKAFIGKMEDYRKFLDAEIVHLVSAENESKYSFYVQDPDDTIRDAVPVEKNALMQFQSMLYASSDSDQKWLLDAYGSYRDNPDAFGLDSLKHLLKTGGMLDAQVKASILESKEWPDSCLSYGTDNRKWLALLDYLLWEKFRRDENSVRPLLECEAFKPYEKKVESAIRNYVFRRNRSVEHLHPQTDTNATASDEWNRSNDIKNIFGNLALISAGRNSEYGNLSVGGKFDRVVKLLNEGGINGSRIESNKLLFMLAKCNGTDAGWTVDKAREHAKDMLMVFKEFFEGHETESV